jgi:hypothetical protein
VREIPISAATCATARPAWMRWIMIQPAGRSQPGISVGHEKPPCVRAAELDSSNSTPEASPTSTTIRVSTSRRTGARAVALIDDRVGYRSARCRGTLRRASATGRKATASGPVSHISLAAREGATIDRAGGINALPSRNPPLKSARRWSVCHEICWVWPSPGCR